MFGYKFTRRDSHKLSVFVLTFFSYAFYHGTRKAFSNVKSSTGKVWTPQDQNASMPAISPDNIWNNHRLFDNEADAERFQGVLDTTFMLAYAVGLFLNGYIGDRVDMRVLLSIGMIGTATTVFIFGCLCEWLQFYNKYFYVFIWVLNGLFQSTGWPVVVACMGNWFGQSSRGVLLGMWSSCASVGNIIGAFMASAVLKYGYEYCFLLTTASLFAFAIPILFGLTPTPQEVGLEPVQEDGQEGTGETRTDDEGNAKEDIPSVLSLKIKSTSHADGKDIFTINAAEKGPVIPDPLLGDGQSINNEVTYDIQDTTPKSMGFLKVVLLPGVIPYSLAYAFLKLVNYSFFFWLPFYLNKAFNWDEQEADQLSTAYDVAGIIGGTLVGFISDRLRKRTILIVPMLILSIPSLFWYRNAPADKAMNTAIMSLIGFLIGGCANLMSAAVAADLACRKDLAGDDKALAQVTGIIDGTGSFGAALGQIAVPELQLSLGWNSVFYLFMICMFLTAACLFPLFMKEVRNTRCCKKIRPSRKVSISHPQ